MSVTTALYTGVSGLLASGESMNVIGNNISNVNTTGFKEGRTLFSDLLSNSAGKSSQIGTGVQLQAVQNIFTQGTAQASENVTDLTIQGNSFFALQSPTVPVTTQNTAFLSRNGAFSVNKDLALVNSDGYQVLDTSGKPIVFVNSGTSPSTDFGKITKIDGNGVITFLATDGVTQNYYNSSKATSGPDLADAVNSSAITAAKDATIAASTATNASTAITAASNAATALSLDTANSVLIAAAASTLAAAKTAAASAAASANTIATSAADTLAKANTALAAASTDPLLIAAQAAALQANTDAAAALTAANLVVTDVNKMAADSAVPATAAADGTTAVTDAGAAVTATTTLATDTTSSATAAATAAAVAGTTASRSVTAANAATVQKIAMVTITDPDALTKVGGSLYSSTANSGVSTAGFSLASNSFNGTSESIQSNSLEQSNVDMASEFVKMITTQRAYSANSKTITTADQMTQEVLGLIR